MGDRKPVLYPMSLSDLNDTIDESNAFDERMSSSNTGNNNNNNESNGILRGSSKSSASSKSKRVRFDTPRETTLVETPSPATTLVVVTSCKTRGVGAWLAHVGKKRHRASVLEELRKAISF